MTESSADNRVLSSEFGILDSTGMTIPVGDWHIHEKRQGWIGFGIVDPGPGEDLDPEVAFSRTAAYGLTPDTPVTLRLVARQPVDSGPSGAVDFMRGWPSVITKVATALPANSQTVDCRVTVLFSDPLSYLFSSRIWGVFKECSPGELLSGALMLASGTEGEPSLTTAIEGLPAITISESVAESVRTIPYAIAAGETLDWWLGDVFGRLGIRMELLGTEQGGIQLALKDGEPSGSSVALTLGVGRPSAGNAAVIDFVQTAGASERATLLDNPSIGQPKRIGDYGCVGRVYASAELSLEEATRRAKIANGVADQEGNVLTVLTGQPGLHPGRAVQFDRPVTGANQWLVAEVLHGAAEGVYRNQAHLTKLGVWSPAPPPERGTRAVSGVVHGAGAEAGDAVPRDSMGRIPVRVGFSQGSGNAEPAASGAEVPPPELMLSVSARMAGETHGFVHAHRHGDVCRVFVHHPMSAELFGFGFADHRRVADDLVDASMGVVVDHGGGKWSGVVFRPKKVVEAEAKELTEAWRAGQD